jgi:type I restriction enzyme S subunit
VKCIEDEIPFELPEGWEWCRVRDIAAVKGGKRLPKGVGFSPCRTAHAYIRVTDMKNHCINTDDLKYISEEVFLQIKNYTISKDDLYVTIAGTIGVTGEVPTELDGMNLTENAVKITNIQINKNYLCLIIQSEFVQQQFQDKTHQVAMPKLALERILSTLIPVCTITTQSAMVSKFVEMDSLINQIREEKEILAETVSLTKSKILDLAIRGKLVPQNPDDEPASVLLERIRAEKEELIKAGKIKRDKKESIIFKGDDNSYYEKVGAEIRCIDSEIPFEIPDGWMYERLGNICSIARGGSPRPIENYLTDDENGLNWIKIGDTEQGGKYIYSTKEKIRPEGLSKTRYVCSGDFLLTNSMSFGRPYILRTNGCIHDGWLVIGGIEIAFHQDYLYYMLSSSIMYNALSSLAVGSTVKNLKSDSVKSLLVPIPPLAEQACISRQIENYFATMLPIERSLS